MTTGRRQFLVAGGLAAMGGACSAANTTQPAAANTQPAAAQAASLQIQISGLVMHGRWPAAKPFVYSGWDALLVEHGDHVPRLRIPIANVKDAKPFDAATNPFGYKADRLHAGIGVWELTNLDVVVSLDGTARGEVAGATGHRPSDKEGKPVPCPDPTKDDQYRDITWIADFAQILGDGSLKDELKGAPKDFPTSLVKSRLRLPQGSIECARPSLEMFEDVTFGYKNTKYPNQFTADLTRFTSKPASRIAIELVGFADGAVKATLELVAGSQAQILAWVENHDAKIAQKLLDDELTESNYWAHHFAPYLKLLKKVPPAAIEPTLSCCKTACDPPLYCIPPGANFA